MPSETSDPKISIVMPALNAEPFLEEAIESVLDQDEQNIELLVVDDSSTDRTVELVSLYQSKDPRVSLLRNQGKGVSSARNTGIENASGKFIAFLDADDTFNLGALSARLEAFEQNEQLALVHGSARLVDESGTDLGVCHEACKTISFDDMSYNRAHLNTVMGRSALIKQFRFEENVTNGEDWWYLARLLRSGTKSDYVPDGGATYRVHHQSTVLQDMEGHESRLLAVLDWLYAPSDEENVATEYCDGLTEPTKSENLIQRKARFLMWNILCGNYHQVAELSAEESVLESLELESESLLKNNITVAGARRFATHLDKLEDVSFLARLRILAAVEVIHRDAPHVAAVFLDIFGFTGHDLRTQATLS